MGVVSSTCTVGRGGIASSPKTLYTISSGVGKATRGGQFVFLGESGMGDPVLSICRCKALSVDWVRQGIAYLLSTVAC